MYSYRYIHVYSLVRRETWKCNMHVFKLQLLTHTLTPNNVTPTQLSSSSKNGSKPWWTRKRRRPTTRGERPLPTLARYTNTNTNTDTDTDTNTNKVTKTDSTTEHNY